MAWVGAAALAALLLRLELRRPDRRRLALRAACVVAAAAALALLLQPPLLPARPGVSGVAIVTTPGTTPALRRRLLDSLPGAVVVPWPDSVPGPAALRSRRPDTRTIVVAGWGLPAAALDPVPGVTVVFRPGPPPPGLEVLDRPLAVRLGDPVVIRARAVPAPGVRVARFEGPGGVRDSARMPGDSATVLVFRATPAAAGTARFVLRLPPADPDTLSVVVLPRRPPAVLVLEAAPAFETRFLRRWLEDQGAAVAVRSRISRDRDRVERVNLPALALRPLTPALLGRFDVVIADGGSLGGLGPAEREALLRAVEDSGLGLLVAPDSAAARQRPFFPFTTTGTGEQEERSVRPAWPGRSDGSLTPVPARPAALDAADGVQPLMRDPVGRVIAATARRGAGAIGTSLVLAPSRWLLEAEPAAFGGYWAALLGALARPRGDRWEAVADGPVVPGLPVILALTTRDTVPQALVRAPGGTTDTLGLARDPAEPSRWWARYWPAAPGTHLAVNRDGEPYPFVVEPRGGTGREARARLAATARWTAANRLPAPPGAAPRRAPLGPVVPFAVLVVALGLLWAEGRRLG